MQKGCDLQARCIVWTHLSIPDALRKSQRESNLSSYSFVDGLFYLLNLGGLRILLGPPSSGLLEEASS